MCLEYQKSKSEIVIINECLKKFNTHELFNDLCEITNNDNENNQYTKDVIIKNIKNDIINRTMDSIISNIIEGEKRSLTIKNDNIIYQITSSENLKKNKNNNMSLIELGECENILKKKYGLNESQTLIILKIDYFRPDSLIPIIGYEIFHPENKSQLDLNYCKNENINISIPVTIDEDKLFKYDPNSEYYTDQCNPYTTDNGTDILINDRQNEYNDNNMSLCENNCKLNEYDSETKIVICECLIKLSQIEISKLNNQTGILSYNFNSLDTSSNMVTMKCYYILFTKEGLIKNIGSYIIVFIFVVFMITIILFHKCGYPLLVDKIKERINLKKTNNKNQDKTNEQINIYAIKKAKAKNKKKKSKNKINKSFKLKNSNKNKNHYNSSSSKMKIKFINEFLISNNNQKQNDKKLKDKQNFNKIINYNDYELNTMTYKNALEYDKRTYLQYYISLIKTKHPLIFSFYPIEDYNSFIIKLDLFFLSFCIYYFFNSLFCNESTIHKIYEDEGVYNFIYSIPFILYSFIISHFLYLLIKYFILSERNIYKIIHSNINDKIDKINKDLIIKNNIFFIVCIIFLVFLWYYLSSFGAVYQNTQKYLIKNTLISFGFSLVYPFIINLIPGIFRVYSLKNNNKECIYKISNIIQIV